MSTESPAKVEAYVATPRQPLSGGDATVIVALIIFILGWVGGMLLAYRSLLGDTKLGIIGTILIGCLVYWPAFWAGGVISRLVGKKN